MKYETMVQENPGFAQAGLDKAARDIAQLLDGGLLNVDAKEAYDRESQAQQRGKVFADFCAVCLKAGVQVPELEPELYQSMIAPPDKEQQQKFMALKRSVFNRLRGQKSREATEARALASALCVLGSYLSTGYSSAKLQNFLGALNVRLTGLQLEPLREDYAERKVNVRTSEAAPSKPVTVVIVDDSTDELIKTALALVGWPGLKVVLYHQHVEGSAYSLSPEQKATLLEKTGREILDLNPSVILMDMGLRGFEGTDLVKELRQLFGGTTPLFVANTGGNDDELRRVGAFRNCDKGRNLEGIREALTVLG